MFQEVNNLVGRGNIRTAQLVGGQSMVKQLNSLKRNPRLIVGTPGRINDHLKRNSLRLNNTSFVTLDEADRIAGVYMNRLNSNMRLQADPTLVFAANDYTIRRVLNKHKRIKSPYNTYIHKGLPPGPIRLASKNYIDAVLNYEKHNYIFMCAKEDFSGYHAFATNLTDHNRNAKKFQKALNLRKIYR